MLASQVGTQEATLLVACRKFFGFRQGQTLKEFADELKCLSDKDRADFEEMFPAVGFKIVLPGQTAAAK